MIPKSGYRFSEKDHAAPKSQSEMTIRRIVISLWCCQALRLQALRLTESRELRAQALSELKRS
jgi:hypothetical protein